MRICPYCFETIKVEEVLFRCMNEMGCPPEYDSEYDKFWRVGNSEATLGKVFLGGQCPGCSGTSSHKICPTCRSDLFMGGSDVDDLHFAVIGIKKAGKSHYLTVLIDGIRNMDQGFNTSLSAINDETRKRYREHFYDPIFKRNETLNVTRSAKADTSVKRPLMYKILFTRGNKVKGASALAFFDTAGEDVTTEKTIKTEVKYICTSHGIIFLVDPLQISEIRSKLADKISLPALEAETEDVVSRVVKVIREANPGKYNTESKKIDIPFAFVFSKIDALESVLGDNGELFTDGNHAGYFNLSDAKLINDVIESFMKDTCGPGFIRTIKNSFEHYAFFGISALGSTPDGTKIHKRRPIRVTDPFLWLLYKNRKIKGKGLLTSIDHIADWIVGKVNKNRLRPQKVNTGKSAALLSGIILAILLIAGGAFWGQQAIRSAVAQYQESIRVRQENARIDALLQEAINNETAKRIELQNIIDQRKRDLATQEQNVQRAKQSITQARQQRNNATEQARQATRSGNTDLARRAMEAARGANQILTQAEGQLRTAEQAVTAVQENLRTAEQVLAEAEQKFEQTRQEIERQREKI
jgi:hypothetical protein